MRAGLAVVVVSACGAFVEPATTTPAPPAAVFVPPPVIVNNTFVTEVNAPPPEPAPPPPPAPPPRPAPPPAAVYPPPPFCTCWATATMPPERANRPSTTIASCDRYLDTAELSGRCSTMDARPLGRLVEQLDLARRNFRRAVTAPGADRASIVESCDLAARQVAESIDETCSGQR
jgi:hypothetical protein